jgi:hypothetical protein
MRRKDYIMKIAIAFTIIGAFLAVVGMPSAGLAWIIIGIGIALFWSK